MTRIIKCCFTVGLGVVLFIVLAEVGRALLRLKNLRPIAGVLIVMILICLVLKGRE